MTASAKPRPKSAAATRLTYRGVKLQTPAARPRFTIAQIRSAVEDAVAKNAKSLARAD